MAVPVATQRWTASRFGLAAFMFAAGISHFVRPAMYVRIVPRVLGHAEAFVEISGVAELMAAGWLLHPRTRRFGGWWTAGLLIAVFPANIQMALDGGAPDFGGLAASPVAAWLRLPLQLPLIWWAWRQTRD